MSSMVDAAAVQPQGPGPSKAARVVGPTLLTIGLAAALSATATPDEKRLALLTQAGLGPDAATLALHAVPVVLGALVIPLGWLFGRGRSSGARLAIYAGFGGVLGFCTALSLNLFAGFTPMLERLVGPVNETGMLDIFGWTLTAFSMFYALVMLALGAFGVTAAQAMNPHINSECNTIDKGDRTIFGWAGMGLVAQALMLGALTALHQAQAPSDQGRLVLLGVMAVAGVLYAWSSLVLWRRYDELYRRLIVDTYAWTGGVLMLAVLAWATLYVLKLAGPVSPFGALIGVTALQIVLAVWLSVKLSIAELK